MKTLTIKNKTRKTTWLFIFAYLSFCFMCLSAAFGKEVFNVLKLWLK